MSLKDLGEYCIANVDEIAGGALISTGLLGLAGLANGDFYSASLGAVSLATGIPILNSGYKNWKKKSIDIKEEREGR